MGMESLEGKGAVGERLAVAKILDARALVPGKEVVREPMQAEISLQEEVRCAGKQVFQLVFREASLVHEGFPGGLRRRGIVVGLVDRRWRGRHILDRLWFRGLGHLLSVDFGNLDLGVKSGYIRCRWTGKGGGFTDLDRKIRE
jgi:hypothetical protein